MARAGQSRAGRGRLKLKLTLRVGGDEMMGLVIQRIDYTPWLGRGTCGLHLSAGPQQMMKIFTKKQLPA